MALIPTQTSTTRSQAFQAALQHLVQLGRIPAGLHINPNPHPIYILSTKDAAGGRYNPDTAEPVSWRYFAADVWGNAVVGDVSNTNPPKVTSLRYGETGKNALKVKKKMEELPDVQADDSDYEPRILRSPAALAEAFWLHSRSGKEGLIVPCRDMFGSPCKKGEKYPFDDFLKALRPAEKVPNSKTS
jgi:hypothetical protein